MEKIGFFGRDIVKLTAQFVARNGAQFLDKLMVREQVSRMVVCVALGKSRI